MLQDVAIHKQQGECVACGKPSRRKCCLCGLFWHPRCASTVLRKVSTQEFFASIRLYPTEKVARDSLKPLGDLAWKSLTEDVVPVLQKRPEGGKGFDFLPNVQMKLGMNFCFNIGLYVCSFGVWFVLNCQPILFGLFKLTPAPKNATINAQLFRKMTGGPLCLLCRRYLCWVSSSTDEEGAEGPGS